VPATCYVARAVTVTFLGTRGYIEVCTPRHFRHAALLVTHRRGRVMIDCGEDWLGRLGRIRPHAIVVTHAHPDHAGGLSRDVPCPVYATAAAWRGLARFDIPARVRRIVRARAPIRIAGMVFEAFPVEHSLRAPAVGYRVTADGIAIFYVPDVLSIPARRAALRGIRLYVGDGASVVRPILRRRGHALFGHTTVTTQIGWCRAEGVPRALFTHCGTGIVAGNARETAERLEGLGRAQGVETAIAHDGLVLRLRVTAPGDRVARPARGANQSR